MPYSTETAGAAMLVVDRSSSTVVWRRSNGPFFRRGHGKRVLWPRRAMIIRLV
jgi:hypothetical protein